MYFILIWKCTERQQTLNHLGTVDMAVWTYWNREISETRNTKTARCLSVWHMRGKWMFGQNKPSLEEVLAAYIFISVCLLSVSACVYRKPSKQTLPPSIEMSFGWRPVEVNVCLHNVTQWCDVNSFMFGVITVYGIEKLLNTTTDIRHLSVTLRS